jgi:hypothetical protein
MVLTEHGKGSGQVCSLRNTMLTSNRPRSRMSDSHQCAGPRQHAIQTALQSFRIERRETFIEDGEFGVL